MFFLNDDRNFQIIICKKKKQKLNRGLKSTQLKCVFGLALFIICVVHLIDLQNKVYCLHEFWENPGR